MINNQLSFEDWLNAVTRPGIGLLIGVALGYVIQLALSGSVWLAGITSIVCAIIWFGLHFLEKLKIGVSEWLFGGAGVRPAANRNRSPSYSWPAKVGRYGQMGGMVLGCLAVSVLPQSMLYLSR